MRAPQLQSLRLDGPDLPIAVLRGTAMDKAGRMVDRVDLSSKQLGAASVAVLASLLSRNRVFIALELNSCGIGPRGIEALAEMLSANRTLQRLNLRSNHADDASAAKLAAVLATHPALAFVDVTLLAGLGAAGESALDRAMRTRFGHASYATRAAAGGGHARV